MANLRHAIKTVAAAGTREVLGSGPCSQVTIRRQPGDTGAVYVGGPGVAAANGFPLDSDDHQLTLQVSDLGDVWLDVATHGDGVCYIATTP